MGMAKYRDQSNQVKANLNTTKVTLLFRTDRVFARLFANSSRDLHTFKKHFKCGRTRSLSSQVAVTLGCIAPVNDSMMNRFEQTLSVSVGKVSIPFARSVT